MFFKSLLKLGTRAGEMVITRFPRKLVTAAVVGAVGEGVLLPAAESVTGRDLSPGWDAGAVTQAVVNQAGAMVGRAQGGFQSNLIKGGAEEVVQTFIGGTDEQASRIAMVVLVGLAGLIVLQVLRR